MRRVKIIIMIFIISVYLTGCYDNREIDTLATVMAVGIENGDRNDEKLYTFALSDTGSLKSKSSGDGTALICCSQSGRDLRSAIFEIDKKISKNLSFSHISAIIFSQEVAGAGMYDDLSFFESNSKVRPQVIVALSEISPKKYLEALNPELEANPEKYFRSIFEKSRSYVANMSLRTFTDSYHTGETVVAPVIAGKEKAKELKEEDAAISSAGIIHEARLVQKLSNDAYGGLLFSEKNVRINNIIVRNIKKPRVEVELSQSKIKVNVILNLKSHGKVNAGALSKRLETFLEDYAKKGIDVLNVKKYLKKELFTFKAYNKLKEEEIMKNTEFNVNIILREGDLKWVGKY